MDSIEVYNGNLVRIEKKISSLDKIAADLRVILMIQSLGFGVIIGYILSR